MKPSNLLPKLFLAVACCCAPLHAQMPPQSQVSFTQGSSGTWNADWDGANNRTYFVQYSLDLVNWAYSPLMRHGTGIQNCGVQTENAPRFFIRLKYRDNPAVNTLVKARLADFDGDGIPNALEYATGGDPLLADANASQLRLVSLTPLVLSLPRNPDASEMVPSLEAGGNLKDWQAVAEADILRTMDDQSIRFEVRSPVAGRFFRIRFSTTP